MEVIANTQQSTQLPPPMSNLDIVHAWRNPRYMRSLSAEQLQRLPGNPAGPGDLTADEVKAAAGFGSRENSIETTAFDCTAFTFANSRNCGCPKATI